LKAEEKMRLKRTGAKHQHGDPNSPKRKQGVCSEDPYPIHPMAGLTWGECYTNTGRNKDAKTNGATSNKVHKKKEKGQEAKVSTIALATERIINDDCNSLISDSDMVDEACFFEQLNADLKQMTGMSLSHDSSQVHIDLDKPVTHHLNELTLNACQHEVATNFLSIEFIDVFTQYCDDSYSSGVRL
jgi:hypothetical protein